MSHNMFRLLVLVLIPLVASQYVPSYDPSLDEQWEDFKRAFNKQYKSEGLEAYRKKVFLDNKQKIDEHNALYNQGSRSFMIGVNELSDMNQYELPKKGLIPRADIDMSRALSDSDGPIQFEATGVPLPPHVDWREKGIVSPVKAQYNCLACWAFASTDAIESQYALKYGKKILLSQQQLVDCSRAEGNLACTGGMVDWGYKYIKRAGGLELASDYPYTAEEAKCQFNESKIVASITNYGEIKNGSEVSLQEAVAFFGPISVSIDSSAFEWNYYTTGIFDSPYCTTDVDHAVLVVGYGTEDGKDYWLVKNSYGESYGDKGYIKMARNKNNQCAIASYANFPIVGEWKSFSPPATPASGASASSVTRSGDPTNYNASDVIEMKVQINTEHNKS